MPRLLREELILREAGQAFADGGYDRASMDQIATRAGISKPMLYAYFGSKEGLYSAYVERTGAELVQRLLGADRPQARHSDRLRALVSEFLAFVEDHRDGWTVLFRELNSRRPLAEQVAQLRARVVAEVRRMLEGGASSWAGIAPPASEGVAEAIVGAGESLANWWLKHPDVVREDVAGWYVGLAQAAITAAGR